MSPVPTLSFNCALVTGGSGGLGKVMASDLIKRGKKVIIAGRTESKLRETASEIGAAAYYILDTGNIPSFQHFITTIISEHPDLDCVINNAGVQRPFQVLGPDYDFDLSKADEEIDINIRGPLHLCVSLIQKDFNNLPNGAVIMNVSSGLGFIPVSVENPVYNGTKACKVKVVEIAPPSVETDLHRKRLDPDDNKKSKGASALSVEEFMLEVGEGWMESKDTIAPGMAKGFVEKWEEVFGKLYRQMVA